MNAEVKMIEWPEISPESRGLITRFAEREYNEIAAKYGAELMPLSVKRTQQNQRYQLLDVWAVASSQPIRWRIKSVLPESGIGAIYGPSGSGKSFLVLDMLMSIAKGASWFNYKAKPCPVVYLCLEGQGGLPSRVAAYCKVNPIIGESVFFMNQPCNLFKSEDVRDLIKAIKAQHETNGILVIDTLNSAVPGFEENSSADMGKAIDTAKKIQLAVGGMVLMVHHTGKDQSKGMRGHSSLFAALDAAIEVKRNGEQRQWSSSKVKDGEDGRLHNFILEKIELGQDEDGDIISSCIVRPDEKSNGGALKGLTPSQKLGMDTFMSAAAKNIGAADNRVHAHLNQWREEFNRTSTAETPGGKRSTFSRVRNELVQMGNLVCENDVYSLPSGFKSIASHESERVKSES